MVSDLFSPGVNFILESLPALLTLALSTFALLRLTRYIGLIGSIPGPLFVFACVLSVPAWIVLSALAKRRREEREAEALYAVLPPRVPSKYPAGIETLMRIEEDSKYGYHAGVFDQWHEELGPIYDFDIMYDKSFITCEPEHIKMMLATQFDNFHKGPLFLSQMKSVLGTGVFNADGELWKFHRSMTRPFFSRDRVGDFDIFDRHATQVVKALKDRMLEGHSINFQDLISRFTLDSATEFLFGVDVKSLSADLPYSEKVDRGHTASTTIHPADAFARAFADALLILAGRSRMEGIWALFELSGDATTPYMKTISSFIDPIVEAALKRKHENAVVAQDGEVPEDATLLDHLVRHTQDQTILKDEILNILIAGRDTTAGLLTFLFYMLAMHPNVLSRLREEVMQKIGPNRRPELEDFRDMKYLRACLNETLRLFPSVPFDLRASINPTTFPSSSGGRPWYIPANTNIYYSAWALHRRKDLWGPDALVFDPNRFLDERLAKYLTPNPFIFMPFNAGPRICLGQQFAYNEASFMVVRLLQNFTNVQLDFAEQPEDSKPPAAWAKGPGRQPVDKIWFRAHLTMYAKGGLWLRMDEAR